MPIYEYACPHCHKTFEEWLKSSDDQTSSFPCPLCGQDAPRIISQTTFILKGGGWYATEYGTHDEAVESDKASSNDTVPASDSSASASEADGAAAEAAKPVMPADTAKTSKASDGAPANKKAQTSDTNPAPPTAPAPQSSTSAVAST